MVGVFVAFIRVVYGRMIYMSLPISTILVGLDSVRKWPAGQKSNALSDLNLPRQIIGKRCWKLST